MNRRAIVTVAVAAGATLPLIGSDFMRALAADAVIAAIIVVSLVLLTGFVGQISFCQYSFAAIGAFTVGSLAGGHGWNFWAAAVLGIVVAGIVGMLVGIPALRLSGLFLAILTVAVALFFDRFVLSPGTWDAYSGGVTPWRPVRPHLFGIDLNGGYAFYLFVFCIFLLVVAFVWNIRTGKSGRVLRAIRDSEIAAQTIGFNLTAWRLGAFGLSAAICGLAGALAAISIGSVSAPSFDFQHSISIAAAAIVMGVGSLASAAAAGLFYVFGPELLRHTPLSARYFPLIVGLLLVVQLVFTPEGVMTKWQRDVRRLTEHLRSRTTAPDEQAEVA